MAVFFRIHDANIHAMHAPGGPVYNLIENVSVTAAELARLNVGKRTMKLMKSIRHNRPSQNGGFKIAGMVYANAKHALWHHEGTPTIFPKHGKYLAVPRNHETSTVSGGTLRKAYFAAGGKRTKAPKTYFTTKSISGQAGNPYLRDGLETAMNANPHLAHTGNV
jgi:hypothetical protein